MGILGSLSANVSVEICSTSPPASNLAKALASIFPSVLPSNFTMQAPALVIFCGDGIRQAGADGFLLPSGGIYSEECDNGASNGLGSCSSSCACSLGFSLSASGTCLCFSTPGFSVVVAESNKVVRGPNEITVQLTFADTVYGLTQAGGSDPFLAAPVIISVSNLTGSPTPDGILTLSTCAGPWATCGLGLAPAPGTKLWRTGIADWQQSTGTLRVTVLQSVTSKQGQVSFSFRLSNPAKMQYARSPAVSACTGPAVGVDSDVSPPILGASSIRVSGPSAPQLIEISKVGLDGASTVVARARLDALPDRSNLTLDVLERLQITSTVRMRMQAGADFAGLLGTAAINTSMQGPVRSSRVNVSLSIAVDSSVVKVRGGCSLVSNRAVRACLPGFVGVFRFSPSSQTWLAMGELNQSTAAAKFVQSAIEAGDFLAVISVPPCSNAGGQGLPAGDKV